MAYKQEFINNFLEAYHNSTIEEIEFVLWEIDLEILHEFRRNDGYLVGEKRKNWTMKQLVEYTQNMKKTMKKTWNLYSLCLGEEEINMLKRKRDFIYEQRMEKEKTRKYMEKKKLKMKKKNEKIKPKN